MLLLALGFTFCLGVAGMRAGERRTDAEAYVHAVSDMLREKESVTRPGHALASRAEGIDRAVRSFVRGEEQSRGFTRLLDAAVGGSWLSSARASYWREAREATVAAAEWRLANFALDAARWQKTAALCDVSAARPLDVLAGYTYTAGAYTKLLGREITPAELALGVPAGTCN